MTECQRQIKRAAVSLESYWPRHRWMWYCRLNCKCNGNILQLRCKEWCQIYGAASWGKVKAFKLWRVLNCNMEKRNKLWRLQMRSGRGRANMNCFPLASEATNICWMFKMFLIYFDCWLHSTCAHFHMAKSFFSAMLRVAKHQKREIRLGTCGAISPFTRVAFMMMIYENEESEARCKNATDTRPATSSSH